MTREEWLEYFEAINGRTATETELAQALAAGEFEDESMRQSSTANNVIYDVVDEDFNDNNTYQEVPKQPSQPIIAFQEEPQQGTSKQDNATKAKHFGKDFANWFMNALKRPEVSTTESHLVFGGITLVLSAGFLAAGVVNYFRRLLMSIANMTTSEGSIKADLPEVYDRFANFVSREFGFGKFLYFLFLILIIYVVAYALPLVFNKEEKSISERFGSVIGTTPLLLVINVLAFFLTFLVKNALTVSESYVSTVGTILTTADGDASQIVSRVLALVNEIPALQSMITAMSYLLIFSMIGLVVLLVSMIKNTKGKLSAINSTYLSVVSVLILLAVVYFVDKAMISSVVKSFVSIKDLVDF